MCHHYTWSFSGCRHGFSVTRCQYLSGMCDTWVPETNEAARRCVGCTALREWYDIVLAPSPTWTWLPISFIMHGKLQEVADLGMLPGDLVRVLHERGLAAMPDQAFAAPMCPTPSTTDEDSPSTEDSDMFSSASSEEMDTEMSSPETSDSSLWKDLCEAWETSGDSDSERNDKRMLADMSTLSFGKSPVKTRHVSFDIDVYSPEWTMYPGHRAEYTSTENRDRAVAAAERISDESYRRMCQLQAEEASQTPMAKCLIMAEDDEREHRDLHEAEQANFSQHPFTLTLDGKVLPSSPYDPSPPTPANIWFSVTDDSSSSHTSSESSPRACLGSMSSMSDESSSSGDDCSSSCSSVKSSPRTSLDSMWSISDGSSSSGDDFSPSRSSVNSSPRTSLDSMSFMPNESSSSDETRRVRFTEDTRDPEWSYLCVNRQTRSEDELKARELAAIWTLVLQDLKLVQREEDKARITAAVNFHEVYGESLDYFW